MEITALTPAPIGAVVRALAELGFESQAVATLLKGLGWGAAVSEPSFRPVIPPSPKPNWKKERDEEQQEKQEQRPEEEHGQAKPPLRRVLLSTLEILAVSSVEEPGWFVGSEPLPLPDPTRAVPLFQKSIEPLFPPLITRAILSRLAATPAPFGEVELASIVDTLAKGQPLTELPRRQVQTVAKGLDLLIDNGPGMEPFANDIAGLVDDLALAVGRDHFSIQAFRKCPTFGITDPTKDIEVRYRPPPGRRPVLVVTDLGVGGPLDRVDRRLEAEWRNFAEELRSSSNTLAVLTPYSRARVPASLRRRLRLITWDRRTGVRLADRSRADPAYGHYDGARRLARIASIAGRIDPQLIRSLRLRLASDLGAEAEADLWFSDLVQSAAVTGLVLWPDDQRTLQQELAADADVLTQAWEILYQLRTDRPWSDRGLVSDCSWLLALEEITYWALKGLGDGPGRVAIERRLKQILKTLITADSERERDAVVWTTAARERLPTAVRKLEPMRLLSLGAYLRGGQTVSTPELAEAVRSGVTTYLAPSYRSTLKQVWLRLVEGGLEASLDPFEAIDTLQRFPRSEAHLIKTVDLKPLKLLVDWLAQGSPQRGELVLNPPRTAFLALESEQVEVTAPDASRFRLSAARDVMSKVGQKTCFVIMGFGEKTDFQSNPQRVLNLDRTYNDIIKPVVEEAGLACIRADEVIHSTVIDKPMYDNLLSADFVIADLSTSNANVIYELGVRHALRPRTTIVMAERGFSFPFDINHLSILKYEHLGRDIGFDEVMRVRGRLKDKIVYLINEPETDSPVFMFLRSPPGAGPSGQALGVAPGTAPAPMAPKKDDSPFAELMESFRSAKAAVKKPADWAAPLELLKRMETMQPDDPYILQQRTLATLKSEIPDKQTSLAEAKKLLQKLAPGTSSDAETVGLWGAIHKRLWELRSDPADLDEAIRAYARGFYIKNDYYNGINYAFMLDVRAASSADDEGKADRVLARRVRGDVLAICDGLLGAEGQESHLSEDEKFWISATKVEALFGLGRKSEADDLKSQITITTAGDWKEGTLTEQLAKLEKLLTPPASVPKRQDHTGSKGATRTKPSGKRK